ncbi:MAG: hypothetical protein HYT49_02705 [Candidatus Wildermuthbacteria bacterium]|nr:hypothetical protein [Candidatus Wildermuthbacteria bacterium]
MDPSVLSITDKDLSDLGIPRTSIERRGIAFFALLSEEERIWACLKRTVRGFLYIPAFRLLIGGVNGCMRTGPECRRMTRDILSGKGWELCGGYHTELVLILTLLVFRERITKGDYYDLLARFRRFEFGADEGEPNREVVAQFIALIPPDVRAALRGSRITLPEMGERRGFVCKACGLILREFGIQTPVHLRVVEPGEVEPSTRHLGR